MSNAYVTEYRVLYELKLLLYFAITPKSYLISISNITDQYIALYIIILHIDITN